MFYTLMNMNPLKRPCPPAVNDLMAGRLGNQCLKTTFSYRPPRNLGQTTIPFQRPGQEDTGFCKHLLSPIRDGLPLTFAMPDKW